jgi:hypothetical protein
MFSTIMYWLTVLVGLLLRADSFGPAQYGVSIVYDPKVNRTTAVCVGFTRAEFEQFCGFLRDNIHLGGHWAMLPMTLVDFTYHMIARWLTHNRRVIVAIAKSKEINIAEYGDNRGFKADLDLDLDAATRKLTFLGNDFAFMKSICKTQERFLDAIEEILLEEQDTTSDDKARKSRELFQGHIIFLRESFTSALQYVERDLCSIKSIAQTVRYLPT